MESNRRAEAFLLRQINQEPEWGTIHLSLAAGHMKRAIALREQRLASATPDTVNARELVIAYESLGDVLGANDRFSLGRPAEAAVWYRKAQALAEKLSNGDPKNVTARLEIARSSGKLGAVPQDSQPAEALRLYQRALDISETLLPDGPDRDALRASAYASMAIPLTKLRRRAEGISKLDTAMAINNMQLERMPNSRSVLSDLADDWLARGQIEAEGKRQAAEVAYRTSLDYADRAARTAPHDLSVAFRQVQALQCLIGIEAADAVALQQRLMMLRKTSGTVQ